MSPFHYLKLQLNIILPSTPGSSKWSLSPKFPHQNPVYTSPLTRKGHIPAHLIRLGVITRTVFGKYILLSSSLCNFFHSPVTSSLFGPNILPNILFLNTLSIRPSLIVSDQVSHPYKVTGRSIFLYIFIFKSLDSKLEDKIFCTE